MSNTRDRKDVFPIGIDIFLITIGGDSATAINFMHKSDTKHPRNFVGRRPSDNELNRGHRSGVKILQ